MYSLTSAITRLLVVPDGRKLGSLNYVRTMLRAQFGDAKIDSVRAAPEYALWLEQAYGNSGVGYLLMYAGSLVEGQAERQALSGLVATLDVMIEGAQNER